MLAPLLACFAVLVCGCSSSAPATSSAKHEPVPAVLATPSDAASELALSDAAPAAPVTTEPTSAPYDRFEVGNEGVGLLREDLDASEESLSALFAGCTVDWQRHKGKATPHFKVTCSGAHIMDVVLAQQGQSGRIDHVSVYREGVGTPSGLGVGSSYEALATLTENMVCRGIKAGSGGPGIIVRDHTLCMSPLFPRVAYILRDVVFNTGDTPANASSLRIAEIRWSP